MKVVHPRKIGKHESKSVPGEAEMRTVVKCLNCGIKWVRVINFGEISMLTEDLCYVCPKCGSNWFEQERGAYDEDSR